MIIKRWIIYTLNDPETGEARYIGATSRSVEKRCDEHVYAANASNYHRNSRKSKWVRSLLSRSLLPVASEFACVVGTGWQEVEILAIRQMRDDGVELVNGTDGGEGVSGRVWSPNAEQRKNMGSAQIGKKASPESRKKRSETLKARYRNDRAQMERRRELARQASRSHNARMAASIRMKSLWADPVRAQQVRENMRAAKEEIYMNMILGY